MDKIIKIENSYGYMMFNLEEMIRTYYTKGSGMTKTQIKKIAKLIFSDYSIPWCELLEYIKATDKKGKVYAIFEEVFEKL